MKHSGSIERGRSIAEMLDRQTRSANAQRQRRQRQRQRQYRRRRDSGLAVFRTSANRDFLERVLKHIGALAARRSRSCHHRKGARRPSRRLARGLASRARW